MPDIDPLKLQEVALTARKALSSGVGSDISCVVASKTFDGDSSSVYKASFSDGVDWAIKTPYHKDLPPAAAAARRRRLDISTQRFIASKFPSMPVPKIHAWSCDDHNPIGRPYIIMDFLPGKSLDSLWHDPSWITQAKRERIFEQLAGWMTELAALEFPLIGRLDMDSGGQIVPFDPTRPFHRESDPDLGLGPYDSAHVYIRDLLRIRRQESKQEGEQLALAVLQLYTSLLDYTLDGPPFSLYHPYLGIQDILVADDGTITGILDWDDVSVGPRQAGAAAYPEWLIFDWVSTSYNEMKSDSVSSVSERTDEADSPDELHRYREMYLAAIGRASGGKLTHITRNSHVWIAIKNGVTMDRISRAIVDRIHRFIFGDICLGYDLEHNIFHGPWYKMGVSQDEIAQLADKSDCNSGEDNSESDGMSCSS